MNGDELDGGLEGAEYTVPRPPKKSGGCALDRRRLSLVLSLVEFLGSDSFLASKSQNIYSMAHGSTQIPGLCVWGVMLCHLGRCPTKGR